MSLQIAVAHTGQRLDADPVAFGSVDALKQWIASATEIPPEFQILLTPHGKHVKLQALLTEVRRLLGLCDLDRMLTVTPNRRKYSFTAVSYLAEPRLPYRQHRSPNLLHPKILQTHSRTTQTCEHGEPSSKPAATGPLRSSRRHTPCLVSHRNTSPNKPRSNGGHR
jgi:hypothetical protein